MNLEQSYQRIIELNHDLMHLAEHQHWQSFAEEKQLRDHELTLWFKHIQLKPNKKWLAKIEQLQQQETTLIQLCEAQQTEMNNEISRLQKQKDLAAKFSF